MKALLALHFLGSLTNYQKKNILNEYLYSGNPNPQGIENQILKEIPSQSDWDRAQERAFKEERHAREEGYDILLLTTPKYPAYLKEIADPPIALFGRGKWPQSKVPLAVVGTRKPTHYGQIAAQHLSATLSEFPINLVSGLALGIDAAIHQGAIDSGAATTAFLAGGMGHFTPRRNMRLAQAMLDGGGGYFTEQPFAQHPEKYTFPVRNRLIAGASLATLVLEAARKSGALITANQAFHYGREVFALPGALNMPMSAGPNALLEDEIAHAVVSWERFPSRFYPLWRKNDGQLDLTNELEGQILQLFPHGRRVKSVQIRQRLNIENASVFKGLRTLIDLGFIEQIGNDTYCRKTVL
jgi:DNA protecting protein DprA